MFSHAFDFAFEVISKEADASDATPAMIRAELINRAINISDSEILEACTPYDTEEVWEGYTEGYKQKVSYKILTGDW